MDKFVSIDIETTGLDPNKCQILEIGAVIMDFEGTNHGIFSNIIKHDEYHGDAYALSLNQKIFADIAWIEKNTPKSDVIKNGYLVEIGTAIDRLIAFIRDRMIQGAETSDKPQLITIAGKNFGSFDKSFLQKAGLFSQFTALSKKIKLSNRYLDPGMLYFNPEVDDVIPNLSECCARAGMSDVVISHRAMDDALVVAKLIVHYYKNICPYVKVAV